VRVRLSDRWKAVIRCHAKRVKDHEFEVEVQEKPLNVDCDCDASPDPVLQDHRDLRTARSKTS
jgi:hypothetical protein